MEPLLLELLHRLEAIADTHTEIGDTVVREALSETVFLGFVRPEPGFLLPETFGLATPDGDRRIREVLEWFLPAANAVAERVGLVTFHQRLAAFQDGNVRTVRTNDTEEFFGWAPPEQFDDAGQLKKPGRFK